MVARETLDLRTIKIASRDIGLGLYIQARAWLTLSHLSPRPRLKSYPHALASNNNKTSHQEVGKLLIKSFPCRTSHHLGHGQSHCWQLINQGTADTRHRCCVEAAKASSWVGSKNSLLYRPLALFYSSSLTLPSRTICEVQHCKQDSRYAVRQCLTGLACAMHNGQELNNHAK